MQKFKSFVLILCMKHYLGIMAKVIIIPLKKRYYVSYLITRFVCVSVCVCVCVCVSVCLSVNKHNSSRTDELISEIICLIVNSMTVSVILSHVSPISKPCNVCYPCFACVSPYLCLPFYHRTPLNGPIIAQSIGQTSITELQKEILKTKM